MAVSPKEILCLSDIGYAFHSSGQQSLGTFVSDLRRCIHNSDAIEGKKIHAHIIKSKHKSNLFLLNTVLNMYVKCGILVDAQHFFEKMQTRNVFTWTVMTNAYVQKGCPDEAIQLFKRMQEEGVKCDKVTYICYTGACADVPEYEHGKYVHASIILKGYGGDLFVANSLTTMYGKCNCVDNAQFVFDGMLLKSVVTWNAIIAVYSHHKNGRAAIRLFRQMQLEGVEPDNITFTTLLSACADIEALEEGKWAHSQLLRTQYCSHLVVANTLIDMYSKCGNIAEAHQVFERMDLLDTISWNILIAAYVTHVGSQGALLLYDMMQKTGIKPANATFISLLGLCTSFVLIKLIHSHIIRSGFEADVFVGSTLVDKYAKSGGMEIASHVFSRMPAKNEVSWNGMLAGYAQQGYRKEALNLFYEMQRQGLQPMDASFINILDTCASSTDLLHGKRIHAHIIKSMFNLDIPVGSAIIYMYSRCGSIADAHQLFEAMVKADIVVWTAIYTGYAYSGNHKGALSLFMDMQKGDIEPDNVALVHIINSCTVAGALNQGKQIHARITKTGHIPDIILCNALIDMYAKCGDLKSAREVFNSMSSKNAVTWNAMIAGYSQHGNSKEALNLFNWMQEEGLKPDKVTYVSAISACSDLAAMDYGRSFLAKLLENMKELDSTARITLVDMYSNCGGIEHARQIYNEMQKQSVESQNAMIKGYAQHGNGNEALLLFTQMQQQGIEPDDITFVSILSVCSHMGLIDTGFYHFMSMSQDHGILYNNNHYACMVDLLGHAGHLDEINDVIHTMPFQPTASLWMSFLSACGVHGKAGLAEYVKLRHVLNEVPHQSAIMLPSNVAFR